MEVRSFQLPEDGPSVAEASLVALLDDYGIPHGAWTQQKTVVHLLAEVRAGESALVVNEAGELRRHTAVAWVDAFSTDEAGTRYRLREDRQEFNDGRPTRRRSLPASLGEKLLLGDDPEDPLEGARRAVKEELGIEDNTPTFVRTAQREAEASSYPGLLTVYTDFFYATEVPFVPGGYQEVQKDKTSYFTWEQVEDTPAERLVVILDRLRESLPALAAELIESYQDMADPANQSFAAHPDDPAAQSPSWHQYGILTHSEKFQQKLTGDALRLAEQWELLEPIAAALNEDVDGLSKGQLLEIVALVHDVGKFTARRVQHRHDGSIATFFTDHEEHSGNLLRFELRYTLSRLGLSEAQIEYVARCSELHFELGKVRRAAIREGGFTLDFARSEAGGAAIQEVLDAHPDQAMEIGLMFVADSLSKTEVMATADTDTEIAVQRSALEQEIRTKGLHPDLINQAVQQPVNLAVAKRYLEQWAARQDPDKKP